MSSDDKDSGFGEVFEPPLSLWKMVEEHVPASERPEIKKILGEHVIDLSLELHREIDTWLKVWHELRAGTFSGDRFLVPSSRPILADPPVIKEMLKQEIRLLLLSIQQKAHSEGRDEDKAIAKYNPKVIHFVLGSSRPGSRMCRPGSVIATHSGEEVPSRIQTASHSRDERASSSLSVSCSLGDTVEAIKEKLTISSIDDVVAHLRSVLEEECQSLKRDVAFLQHYVMEEKDYTEELMAPDPTLKELKEERRVIERDLQMCNWPELTMHVFKPALARSSDESTRPVALMFQSSATEIFHGGIAFAHRDSASLENTMKTRGSSCLPGLKLTDKTCKTAGTSVLSGTHGNRCKLTSLKCIPPELAKPKVAAEVAPLLPGNSGCRTYNMDSRTSSKRESYQKQTLSCLFTDSINSRPPHAKVKLSDVKAVNSDVSLVDPPQNLPDLRLMAQNRCGPVLIPTPPSNQRSSSSSSAATYRRVRCLQSNSTT